MESIRRIFRKVNSFFSPAKNKSLFLTLDQSLNHGFYSVDWKEAQWPR